jgi:pimeloyl-ACP methyl ester carboxylesterase
VNIVVGKEVFDELPPDDRLVINQNAHTLGPMLRTYFEPTNLDHSSASKMTTPTLLITGELSPGIYKAITRELYSCMPTVESFTLPGASHGLHMENGEDFGVAAMKFLSKNKGLTEKNS